MEKTRMQKFIITLFLTAATAFAHAADDPAKTKAAPSPATIQKQQIQARVDFANRMEKAFLDQGMDVYVTTPGKLKDTLKLKYVLMSRPMVHQMMQSTLPDNAKKLGFKRMVFTDGYDESWSANL
jgi:hypothetical protein